MLTIRARTPLGTALPGVEPVVVAAAAGVVEGQAAVLGLAEGPERQLLGAVAGLLRLFALGCSHSLVSTPVRDLNIVLGSKVRDTD